MKTRLPETEWPVASNMEVQLSRVNPPKEKMTDLENQIQEIISKSQSQEKIKNNNDEIVKEEDN